MKLYRAVAWPERGRPGVRVQVMAPDRRTALFLLEKEYGDVARVRCDEDLPKTRRRDQGTER